MTFLALLTVIFIIGLFVVCFLFTQKLRNNVKKDRKKRRFLKNKKFVVREFPDFVIVETFSRINERL